MKKSGIREEQRLRRKRDFERVIKEGKKIRGMLVDIFIRENGLEYLRFGVIVAKKVSKKAVRRNRMKRLLREFLRLNQKNFRGKDIVLFAKKDFSGLKLQQVEKELLPLLKEKK